MPATVDVLLDSRSLALMAQIRGTAREWRSLN